MRKTKDHTKIVVICCNIVQGEFKTKDDTKIHRNRALVYKEVQPKVSRSVRIHICELNSWKFARPQRNTWPLLSDRLTQLKHESPASFLCTATTRRKRGREREVAESYKFCSLWKDAVPSAASTAEEPHHGKESLKVRFYLFRKGQLLRKENSRSRGANG